MTTMIEHAWIETIERERETCGQRKRGSLQSKQRQLETETETDGAKRSSNTNEYCEELHATLYTNDDTKTE